MEELNINIEIDLKSKELYIAEESSSGAEYKYNNLDDLVDNIKTYLLIYYKDDIEK